MVAIVVTSSRLSWLLMVCMVGLSLSWDKN